MRSAAEDQGIGLQEFILPRSIEAQIARLADAIGEPWPERFSAPYLKKRVRRLAMDLAAEPIGEETQARFVALLEELKVFSERKLCVAPVEGVAVVSDDPVAFGPLVLRR